MASVVVAYPVDFAVACCRGGLFARMAASACGARGRDSCVAGCQLLARIVFDLGGARVSPCCVRRATAYRAHDSAFVADDHCAAADLAGRAIDAAVAWRAAQICAGGSRADFALGTAAKRWALPCAPGGVLDC